MLFSFQREFQFDLVPNRELKRLDEDYDWRAVGNDPYFVLKPVGGGFPSGWVMMRTTLKRVDDSQPAKLYYDAGSGMREETAIVVPVGEDGRVEELIKLPYGTRSLRWDPMEAPGKLTQGPLVISRVGVLRAWRMLRDSLGPAGFSAFFIRLFLRHERLYKELSQVRTRIAGGTYQQWIRRHQPSDSDKKTIRRHIDSLARRPLISVLMPVYNPSAAGLREAISSVQAQLYPNWELCIADDASTAPHVKEILESYRSDPRIKIEYRALNGHISAASNSALALARGEFIALLDHDDVLSEQALYQVAAELDDHPNADIIYSDEDKIYEEADLPSASRRGDPHFKSSWNPDLLYAQNYISHLGVYRAALVKSIGGFRQGLEGSQDYDLLLRCLAAKQDAEVRHIPAILYHWRASSGSTALSASEKSYATEHGIAALKDHFRNRGMENVLVEAGRFPTTYHVRFPLPEPAPKVSIIIPTRNHHNVLRLCIDSIRNRTTYPNYEIVVVDNQSDDPDSLSYFAEIEKSGVRILRYERPFNYSAINNFAVQHVDGELIALVNNDIEVISPDWLTEMASHAIRPGIGAVGAKLYYDNDTIQHGGVIVGLGGVAGHSHKHLPRDNPGYFRRLCLTQNLSAVTGACLVVRRESYLKVGGLDAVNLTIAFNDVDFCLKLWAIGLRNLWTPYAELYHHESVSRGPEDSPEKVARFKKEMAFMKEKWGERLRRDPYYNPMLTLDWENFTPDFRNAPRKPWLNWLNQSRPDHAGQTSRGPPR